MKQIEKLYLKYKQEIYNYLLSITHNPTLSEDLLSETFVKAIYSITNFKGNSSIKTWLFGIARHLWLQNLRKDKPSVEYSDLLELYVTDSTMDIFITKQIGDRVWELLKTKDEQTQKIVSMRINGISYYEISEKISISENSARVIDFRTKKWLKSILKKEELI
ncbi:RNA polymerase sigma-70 factor (ECF subfamily) [Anaerosolibacter carboniphilus]|uniref:RNA polymerase sigma-70 factor (ECF subfamily) n=1 Tax=Anaerosolibacter carboniphilus TaxID=1417629 RepID=A0A841L154_9FIRM|nr:RNA polymerase sigma factor [Anaerosolibacter carboniphilus]MBB6218328.1 RNA polymerase sigma-70 factor (ECF subfamily) [Anaerosolibacter carboniphilus]